MLCPFWVRDKAWGATGSPLDPQAVVGKSWLGIGIYLRIEWQRLKSKIRSCRFTLNEAIDRFSA